PSGAVVDYAYALDGVHNLWSFTDNLSAETITQKKVTHDGTFDIWSYAVSELSGIGSVTNPDGGSVTEVSYCSSPGTPGCAIGKSGLAYRTNRPFMRTERHWSNLLV